jgi:hypothetical protein
MKSDIFTGKPVILAQEYQTALKKAGADIGFNFITYSNPEGGIEIKQSGGQKITSEQWSFLEGFATGWVAALDMIRRS